MTPPAAPAHHPVDIAYDRAARVLEIEWNTGVKSTLPAEYLRVESPSAEVRGHDGKRRTVAGRRHVAIIGMEPVGNYAVRLIFDDLHDSGLFSWDHLWDLHENRERRWADYLDDLAAAGLGRDP